VKLIKGSGKFTIQNFDQWINSVILLRGEEYYNDGAILEIEETKGAWSVEVQGSDVYLVNVSLIKDNEIAGYNCDCPHDADICKHITAAFFAIREEINNRIKITAKSKKKNSFDSLLAHITADEYSVFVKQYAAKHKDFKIAFEIFFADKDDSLDVGEKYTSLIKKLVKKYSIAGYVDYRSSSLLGKEAYKLIEKSYELVAQKNYIAAFAIATAVLKEMLDVLTYSDDSSGSLGDVVFNAVEAIDAMAKSNDIAPDMKGRIFQFLSLELTNRIYFAYGDFGYGLLSTFEYLATALNKADNFIAYIDNQLNTLTGEYDHYRRDFLNSAKISFLETIGRTAEVELLIQQNLNIQEIRQREIDKAIDREDFKAAKKLIAGGIETAEASQHPGVISQWEKQLLRIAMIENDLPLVRSYCRQFAIDGHTINEQYYDQWKATYKEDEWRRIIDEEIENRRETVIKNYKPNSWGNLDGELLGALSPFYIKENYIDELFQLVKKVRDLRVIIKYHRYLLPFYPDELVQIYIPALELLGDASADRSDYYNLAQLMKQLIKDLPRGKDQIISIAEKLKLKYPRRPAMIDELNKLLK